MKKQRISVERCVICEYRAGQQIPESTTINGARRDTFFPFPNRVTLTLWDYVLYPFIDDVAAAAAQGQAERADLRSMHVCIIYSDHFRPYRFEHGNMSQDGKGLRRPPTDT